MEPETQMTQQPKRKRVNLTLTPETHGRIKVHCAKKGTTMQATIEAVLDDYAAQAAAREAKQ
jgi:predicted DNA binding CopG/RHH family protein